jgi:hypothetical protein
VHGDSRQNVLSTWKVSELQARPISPDTLDSSSLHQVFSHLWTAARPVSRIHEEWPRVGVGGESRRGATMSSENNGRGYNRP